MRVNIQLQPSFLKHVISWSLKCFSPTRCISWQISRSVLASVLSSMVDCGVLIILVESIGFKVEISAVISYLLGGVFNYILCSVWVFSVIPRNKLTSLGLFTCLSLVGLAITWVCMESFHGLLGLKYMLAKTIALLFTFVWNFSSRKLIIFK